MDRCVPESPGDDAFGLVINVVLAGQLLLDAGHGVSLAGAGLAIGEDSRTVALQGARDQLAHSDLVEHFSLFNTLAQNMVVSEVFSLLRFA